MEKEELKKRALSVTKIPDHFHPVIEEYIEGENGEGEAIFSWTNAKEDEGISVNLDLSGHLTRLSIELNEKYTIRHSLSVKERKERAEQFLLKYYPRALEELSFDEKIELDNAYRFSYERLVMDIPLMASGALIDVDPEGNIVQFSYEAAGKIPEIPTTLISKEKLVEHVKQRLNFELIISNLYSSIHSVTESGIRLVFEPEPSFMNYRADVLSPTLSIIHDDDEDIQEIYKPLAPPNNAGLSNELSVNEIIGVTKEMEMIREVDFGAETGVVWRDRNWKMEEQDLSIDGFFKRQTEDTVKAFISKETGKVRGFMWFNERSGDFSLTREECLQKAIDFIQIVIPNYHKYLQLIVRENEEGDDVRKKEVFTFHVHNRNGIPILLELIIVAVNRQTGQIDHYSGPSFDIEQLNQSPTDPAISSEQAKEIFLKHLDFELAWHRDYDDETNSYILVYQACDLYSRTPIRYIDAMTGAVITAKDL